jgi:hypothetical protein
MSKDELRKLRKDYPNSLIIDQEFDPAIFGVHVSGVITYNPYGLLYMILDQSQDEFPDENYEMQKADFSQEFQDFYDLDDEQLCWVISEFKTMQRNSNKTRYPLFIKAGSLNSDDDFDYKNNSKLNFKL